MICSTKHLNTDFRSYVQPKCGEYRKYWDLCIKFSKKLSKSDKRVLKDKLVALDPGYVDPQVYDHEIQVNSWKDPPEFITIRFLQNLLKNYQGTFTFTHQTELDSAHFHFDTYNTVLPEAPKPIAYPFGR